MPRELAHRVEELLRLGLQATERGRDQRPEQARLAKRLDDGRGQSPLGVAGRGVLGGELAAASVSLAASIVDTARAYAAFAAAAAGASARAIVHQTSGSTPSDMCVERTSTWRAASEVRSRHARQSTTPSRRV